MSRRQNRGFGLRQHIGIGRPSKLIPEVRDKFLASIRAGNFRETAAKIAGISPATLYRWLGDDREPFRTFLEDVERAEAEFEQSVVASVTSHIPDDPKLALALLAKRFPHPWGPKGEGRGPTRTAPNAVPRPPLMASTLDPRVGEDYQRLAPVDRWRRTMIAVARGDEDEELRLAHTCPPGDVPTVSRLFNAGAVVVLQAFTIWLGARGGWDQVMAVRAAVLLADRMFELGAADSSNGRLPPSSTPDSAFERAGPIGQQFLDISLDVNHHGVAPAEQCLVSVRAGILRFVQWLGFGEVQSFAASLPELAKELNEFEPRSSVHIDHRVATEIDDKLRAIWERS
jgi:hypothetical protein